MESSSHLDIESLYSEQMGIPGSDASTIVKRKPKLTPSSIKKKRRKSGVPTASSPVGVPDSPIIPRAASKRKSVSKVRYAESSSE